MKNQTLKGLLLEYWWGQSIQKDLTMNLLGMVAKPNLAADSDLAGRVDMGACALCNTLITVRNNLEGLGMGMGREARNLLGMVAGHILSLIWKSHFYQVPRWSDVVRKKTGFNPDESWKIVSFFPDFFSSPELGLFLPKIRYTGNLIFFPVLSAIFPNSAGLCFITNY